MSNIAQKLAEKLAVQGRTDEADANHQEQPDPQAGTHARGVELGVHGEPLIWHTERHDSNRPEHRYGEEHYGSPKAGRAGGYAGGHKEQYGGIIENVSQEPPAKHHEGLSEKVELGAHGEPLKWRTELHDSNRPEHRYGEEHYGSPEPGRAGGYAGGHKEQYGEIENLSPEPPAKHREGLLEKVRRKIQGKKKHEGGAGEESYSSSSSESDGEGGRRKKKPGLF